MLSAARVQVVVNKYCRKLSFFLSSISLKLLTLITCAKLRVAQCTHNIQQHGKYFFCDSDILEFKKKKKAKLGGCNYHGPWRSRPPIGNCERTIVATVV